jgi:glycosyltransferase involved in cell wall biosynthesis
MKILHFLGSAALPADPDAGATGGTTRVALELARAQLELGHETWVATVGRSSWEGSWNGVRLAVLPEAGWAARGRLRSGVVDAKIHAPLMRLCAAARFDVVDAHEYRLLGFLPRCIRLAHLHNNPFWSEHTPEQWWYQRLEFQLLQRFPDRCVAVSEYVARQLHAGSAATLRRKGGGIRDVDVVHNGVDLDRFNPAASNELRAMTRQQLGIPSDAVVFLFAGAIAPEKGVTHLAEAFARLAAEMPSARLIIAGGAALWANEFRSARPADEAYERAVQEILAGAAAAGRVVLAGVVPPAGMARLYAASDVLVIASLQEACPLVLLEALAAGRPAIATAVGGIPELVDDATAILVPPQDPESLFVAMRRLGNDPALRTAMASRSRDSVARQSWRGAAGRLDAVIASAGTPRRGVMWRRRREIAP